MTFSSDEWTRLEAALRGLAREGRFALAYSGGLDSRFVAHAAALCGLSPLLLHVSGPHVPPEESAGARAWAARRGFELSEVRADPLALPEVAAGDPARCYACKRHLFSRLQTLTDGPLCDGTNASDAGQYRPGLKALRELGVLSPLALAAFDKAAIRRWAARTGMEDPDQRARPCLLTRLPYGMKPEREVLAALARGEEAVRESLAVAGLGGRDFRLRLVGPGRAELHLTPCKLPPELRQRLEELLGALPPLPAARIVMTETLSGYFDRVQPAS